MNYFPINGGGSNLKYYVDGVQKKLKGYKVYKVPPILYGSSSMDGSEYVCSCSDGIHYFIAKSHQRIDIDGNIEMLNALPYSTKVLTYGGIYECNDKIYLLESHVSGGYSVASFYLWDKNQDTWTLVAQLSIATSNTSAMNPIVGEANGNMYVVYLQTETSQYNYIYKFNDVAPHFERIGGQLPNINSRPYNIIEVGGKLCVLYSNSAYYLVNNTWTQFALSEYPGQGYVFVLDGKPCFKHSVGYTRENSDRKSKIYEITLNGVVLNREIEEWYSPKMVAFDEKIHSFSASGDFVGTYGNNYSHIMFDDDGKGYFQKNPFEPVMIPIFE